MSNWKDTFINMKPPSWSQIIVILFDEYKKNSYNFTKNHLSICHTIPKNPTK
ncbi:39_t:CDS:1, partial [Acaulospora morrowiae]